MNSNNVVFVLDTDKRPMTPCSPARARQLMKQGKAAVYRRFPFILILKEAKPDAVVKPLTVKLDPGAKVTGIAITDTEHRVLFAAELEHRGRAIKDALESRRSLRRGRRNRKTRYRAARFDNRRRPEGWLPPSLQHRVDATMTWVKRFQRWVPTEEIAVERVKFDMQKMQNPEISGVEYQQGELQGFEVREYLLEKFGRACVYCRKEDVPLEVEHVQPRSKSGSNRVSNLTIACRPCNGKKGNRPVEEFLKSKPDVLAKLKRQLKTPLKDAAAVNATRNKLFDELLATGLPVEAGSGAQTKFNRRRRDYPKAHWMDAACVGESGATASLDPNMKPLRIKATGHGCRQRQLTDSFGFPRGKASPAIKSFAGYQTGDLVSASIPKGKYAGSHKGRIAIRHRPSFRLATQAGQVFDVHPKYLKLIQRNDGYAYS
jgi:5-methylcytosine-specific restriction endonuclease McrA